MPETAADLFHGEGAIGSQSRARSIPLALRVLLVGVVCHLSTEFGFAHKFPPHNISPLWPTGAILFGVLVATPVRHWWAYTFAAYFTSVINDGRAGFPLAGFLYLGAGLLENLIAAVGVRRFAGGLQACKTLHNLLVYILAAVLLGPFVSAFIAAFAGASENYLFYWRVWFLSEALAYLTLAPAILIWIGAFGEVARSATWSRCLEATMLGGGLLAISIRVFHWPIDDEGNVAALVYLPLPLLLWAAVRFGAAGVNTALVMVACVSISGAVGGRGPFIASTPAENVLSLQLFLAAVSVPLMFLGALIEEVRAKAYILSESEARFRSLADSSPVMIWTSDPAKQFDYVNRPWLDFTGRTMQQEMGEGWTEGVHPEDRARCWNTYATAFDARQPFELEYRLRRRDGEYRWILDKGIPRFAPDGGFAGYIGSCLDIADRKQAELELQQQRRELAHLSRVAILGELSGALAHELNQPLTAILSNAEAAQLYLVQKAFDAPELQDILNDIVSEDKRAGEVIRRMRALLKKGETQFQTLDLNEVASEVLGLAHSDFVARGVAVNSELAPQLPAVRGDRIQLQQVLLNLIVNGCDAMSATEPWERRLTILTGCDEHGLVQVSISDSGGGIPEERMHRLFEPFFTTKEQGLGLGLAISHSIVVAHGGRLWAANNAQRGATFCLTLPVHYGGSS